MKTDLQRLLESKLTFPFYLKFLGNFLTGLTLGRLKNDFEAYGMSRFQVLVSKAEALSITRLFSQVSEGMETGPMNSSSAFRRCSAPL